MSAVTGQSINEPIRFASVDSQNALTAFFDGRPILGEIAVRVLRTMVGDNIPGESWAPHIPAGSHARVVQRHRKGYYIVAFDGFEVRVPPDCLELLPLNGARS
jgi:hypothetical protein